MTAAILVLCAASCVLIAVQDMAACRVASLGLHRRPNDPFKVVRTYCIDPGTGEVWP